MKRLWKKRMTDASFSVLASIGAGQVGRVGGEERFTERWMNGSHFEMFPWNNSLTCGRDEIHNLLSQLFQKSMQVCKKVFGFPLWN